MRPGSPSSANSWKMTAKAKWQQTLCGSRRRRKSATRKENVPISTGYYHSPEFKKHLCVPRQSLNIAAQNELYISPSWDMNPLASINGKAKVMSLDRFLSEFPSGKIPRHSKNYGKTFVCRRGCNTRTAAYTEEFLWEELYTGVGDLFKLIEYVESGTKAVRGRRKAREQSPSDTTYLPPPQTPTKGSRTSVATPQSKRGHAEPGSRSQKKYVTR